MIKLLSKIITLKKLYVVGVIRNDEEEIFHIISLSKSKNSLVVNSQESFVGFDALVKTLDKKIPVIVNIDGKGVLNKKISFENEEDLSWQRNLDLETIFYTSYESQGKKFISFCRRTAADGIITTLQSHKIDVLDVYIGNFLSALLQDTLKNEQIVTGNLELHFEAGILERFQKYNDAGVQYKIGDTTVTNKTLPLYAVGLAYFVKPDAVSKSDIPQLQPEERIYKQAFNYFGLGMLLFFFTSLLASYLLIQYYINANAQLNIQNLYSDKAYKEIITLEAEKRNKEKLIKELGLLSDKFYTFYAYEILKTVPATISLNQLEINPLIKEVEHDEKAEFDQGTIVLKGSTSNEYFFDNWVDLVKKLGWVKKLEIESLEKDKKQHTIFTITISAK